MKKKVCGELIIHKKKYRQHGMIEKYKERVLRAKSHNIKKKMDKKRKYTERVSRAKNHNMSKKKEINVECNEECIQEEIDIELPNYTDFIDGYPPNNFIEKGIAYLVQRNFKCNVLFK